MDLAINGKNTYQVDDFDTVSRHLMRLPVNQFAILSADQQGDFYVQTYRNGENDFQLEYQDGDLDKHYIADDGNTPLTTVIAAFEAYFNQGDIAGVTQWKLMDLS